MPEENNSHRLPYGNEGTGGDVNGLNNGTVNYNDIVNDPSYQGSMQQILADNTGRQVVVDFLVGSTNIVRKEGILYMVGQSYIVIYEPRSDSYTVCNLYSVEFVTFLSMTGNGNSNQSRAALKRV